MVCKLAQLNLLEKNSINNLYTTEKSIWEISLKKYWSVQRGVKISQSCLTLCNPIDLYSPWNSPGQNTGVGGLSFFQGVFETRDWTQISSIAGGFFTSWATREAQNTGVGSPSLLQWNFPIQESNQGFLHCRQSLYQLSYEGSPLYKVFPCVLGFVVSSILHLRSQSTTDPEHACLHA